MKIKVLSQDLLHLNMKNFDEKILKILICPKTGKSLLYDKKRKYFTPKILITVTISKITSLILSLNNFLNDTQIHKTI